MSDHPDPVLAALARLEQGQRAIEQSQQALEHGYRALSAKMDQGHRDIMARIDRLQDTVTGMQSDMTVNLGAVQHVEHREEHIRDEVRSLTTLVFAMERQILHLQTEVREIRGRP